ncbi:hypothetical protein NEOLEDRAFT_1143432 [Neolentinus lepideus HHB14362 ss-1]|uniref:Uncharacterized protein n=1 Tax=Neolentinus lepideus HHB14362 ss-1 TaxID=1314782 RepID=A0A165MJJ3_9AGAM|nr:hypothetical protein NEOLEDRAFT_1143432 [Neolentinus lepideus HHB14362 ss-1]
MYSSSGTEELDSTLRFISKDPVLTIYTANFAIRPFSSNTLSNSTAIEPSPTTQAPVDPAPSNDMQPFFLTLVMPNSTVVSELPLRPSPTPVTTYYAGEEHYNSSPGPGQFQPKNKPYSASLSRSAVVDLEKLKFRIIFILWPALMGITMSI